MGKLLMLVVVGALGVVGYRFYSLYQLEEAASEYREALYQEAMATQRGTNTIPSKALIAAKAGDLAEDFGLSLHGLEVEVQQGARPTGVGGMAADRVGELPGQATVEATGKVGRPQARSIKTTLVEIHARVQAKGFLCELDREVHVSRNFGFALR